MGEAHWYMAIGGQQAGPVGEQDVVDASGIEARGANRQPQSKTGSGV
ncbi:MAG TPA: hypothetical protein VFM88_14090 [Vicinamibacteria bacterium]|nr:hypothetical protein [Vicinamibacteria bacterium]